MDFSADSFETLKQIVRNFQDPEKLDDHPWTRSLVVQELLDAHPSLNQVNPGQRLIAAIAQLFRQIQPSVPPRRGKRLDSRWGEFGLLAALYFAPLENGTPFPTSLMDAWGRIDPAILYFVYGRSVDALSKDELERYQLVGDEIEYGSVSTLSDWHKKGLQRLSEIIVNRERYLERNTIGTSKLNRSGEIESPGMQNIQNASKPNRLMRHYVWLSLIIFLVFMLGWGAFRGWKVYQLGMLVYGDVSTLQKLMNTDVGVETLAQARPVLGRLDSDLADFKKEAKPFLWVSRWMGWVPEYGYDITSAPVLIDTAEHLVDASLLTIQAAQPLLNELETGSSSLNIANLTDLLVKSQPQFKGARIELDAAFAAWETVDTEQLSPKAQSLLTGKLDPVLELFDEGLSLATALPNLLGAGAEGPKTYLLLAQNEDELRPTGGLITAVGTLVVKDGQVLNVTFVDSGELDNWAFPYPISPWQLEQYMNSPVLVLRDSNWFVDFPTSALYAETLFAYNYSYSVDGIIAFDQHMLVLLLQAVGPLDISGVDEPVTADNVIAFMRRAKSPPVGEPLPEGWSRKGFIEQIAKAMLERIYAGGDNSWEKLGNKLLQGLNQRHLLLQMDDPDLSSVIERRGWDGALNIGTGDYIRVVDANVGFNKTSALVETSMVYDVDLTELTKPVGNLTITHKNNSNADVECIQWGGSRVDGEKDYPVNACYWNYMRVYKPFGTKLLSATPQIVPNDWMVLGHGVDGQVDELEEDVEGVQAFGTLMVVPGDATIVTSFKFGLPEGVLLPVPDIGQMIYSLKVDKQPGTIAVPFTLRVHFPNRVGIVLAPPGSIIEGNDLLIKTNLDVDKILEIVFRVE